jgi:ABC-type uncharacterized transport system substrate-binding protein
MKKPDEQFNLDDAQLNALMTVIKEITSNQVPVLQPHELTSRSILRSIQWAIGDLNALDHSELIDTLNQAIIEIKYFVSIITDRNNQIRALQSTNNYQASEIQRLENQVFRDK